MMSALNVACLPLEKCILICADTAGYTDGVVVEFASKIYPVPSWPGAISGVGMSLAADVLAPLISAVFETFDDAIAGIEAWLPDMLEEYGRELHIELVIAGWSQARQAAESYSINTSDRPGLDQHAYKVAAARLDGLESAPLTLTRLADFTIIPQLSAETTVKISLADEDLSNAERVGKTMRLLIEAQRHQCTSTGLHLVGGSAEMCIITPDSVHVETICEWPDRIGKRIKPISQLSWGAFRQSLGLSFGYTAEQQASFFMMLGVRTA